MFDRCSFVPLSLLRLAELRSPQVVVVVVDYLTRRAIGATDASARNVDPHRTSAVVTMPDILPRGNGGDMIVERLRFEVGTVLFEAWLTRRGKVAV
jgi:hypothetical protein